MVFDANTGKLSRVLTGLSSGWRAAAFTRDGQYLLGVSESGTRLHARVWRTSNWSLYRQINAQLPHWLRAVAISPDARWLAVGGWNYLQIYDLATGEKVTDLPQPGRYVYALDFSPDGQYLASANENTQAVLWSVSDWSQVRVLAETPSDMLDLKFSPDGNYLALSSGTTLRVWSTSNWDAPLYTKDLGPFGSDNRQVPLTFSADSQRLAVRHSAPTGDVSTVKVLRVSDGAELWRYPWLWQAAFLRDGRAVAVLAVDGGWGQHHALFDSESGSVIRPLAAASGDFAVRDAVVTPDDKYLVTVARGEGWNWDSCVRVWRLTDGQLVFAESGWNGRAVDIAPSGGYLAMGSGDSIRIKQVTDTGDTLQFADVRSWRAHGNTVNCLRFAPNGLALVSGAEDATVKVWRLQDAGMQYELSGHTEPVYSVAVAQDGSDLLVAAGGWGGVALWRVPMPGAGNTPVSTPQLVYPAPGADLNDWVLMFQASDPDAGDQLRFRVEVLNAEGTVVKRYDGTVDTSLFDKPFASSEEVVAVSLDTDLVPGTYRFRVQATDGWAWSAWSEERTFTLVKPVLPLGQTRTLCINAGGRWRATVNVPEGSEKLFLTCRSVERAVNHTVRLYQGGTKLVEQAGGDVFVERTNPSAGEYEIEIVPAEAGQVVVYAGTALPSVRIGARYTGTIYHSDGYDWLQMDVPQGVHSLQFTVEAPGNLTELTVWRGSIGSWEKWSASQRFNPPVRLTINNPPAGRYYLRVMDHAQLTQTQVRQYQLTMSGPQASLSAQVSPTMTSAGSPDPVAFTVQYTNEGSAPASSVVLRCVLPDVLNVEEGSVSEGGTYDATTRTVQWDLGDLAAGASGTASFRAKVSPDAPGGTNLSVPVSLESPDLPETVVQPVTLWVGAAGIVFDNVYTLFDDVHATIGGLSIDRAQGTPRVWLEFPAGTAISTVVDAEEVTISEDGTRVTVRFALMDKVSENVAPTLHLSHPSVGTKEWQAPTLQVFGIESDLQFNKPFIRMGRKETMHLRVTNPNAIWGTPFVKIQLALQNVPADESVTVSYEVYAPGSTAPLKSGQMTTSSHEVGILLPQIAPGTSADYRLTLQVTSSRSAPRTRIEPLTLAIVFVVSEVVIFSSWAGHSILQSGCEKAIKRRLREDFALEGVDLSDEQINRLYDAYRQASNFASAWLSELAKGAGEQYTVNTFKEYVVNRYGAGYAKAAELAYKVYKGECPIETLLGEITSVLAPDLDWVLLPASTAVKAFLAEGQDCIEKGMELRKLARRFNSRKQSPPGGLRIVRSWDPNAKSGTFGVDGFIPDGQVIDYTIYFENLSTATANAEEVLIQDTLDANLDGSTLVFTGFGFGDHEVTLPVPLSTLSQGIDLGNNLVVRVEGGYDPSTSQITVRFKGIDTRTGEHYEGGFLPPNRNEPEGEGYVSFRIQPKADIESGARIVNKATITFDPHLGSNPPMETNEHVLTLDKQAPQVAIVDMPAVQNKPIFPLGWQGSDDSSGIKQVEVWYDADGSPLRLWHALSPQEGSPQAGSATFQGRFGYTYRFYAVGEDKVGNRVSIPVEPQAVVTAGLAPEVPSGLRLIALPVLSEEADAKRVLAFDADKMGTYHPGTGDYVRYPNATLQVGRGYWVQLPNAQRPSIRGEVADEAQPYVIPLQQGWNLIGNP
jgi:WD40 repeat protein